MKFEEEKAYKGGRNPSFGKKGKDKKPDFLVWKDEELSPNGASNVILNPEDFHDDIRERADRFERHINWLGILNSELAKLGRTPQKTLNNAIKSAEKWKILTRKEAEDLRLLNNDGNVAHHEDVGYTKAPPEKLPKGKSPSKFSHLKIKKLEKSTKDDQEDLEVCRSRLGEIQISSSRQGVSPRLSDDKEEKLFKKNSLLVINNLAKKYSEDKVCEMAGYTCVAQANWENLIKHAKKKSGAVKEKREDAIIKFLKKQDLSVQDFINNNNNYNDRLSSDDDD
ncbi:MAG: hypothetical protein K2W92_08435 [Alphaproteobacteria bacterium]|nr:hypothetical protein [Alphaproteobacteria bacterium]